MQQDGPPRSAGIFFSLILFSFETEVPVRPARGPLLQQASRNTFEVMQRGMRRSFKGSARRAPARRAVYDFRCHFKPFQEMFIGLAMRKVQKRRFSRRDGLRRAIGTGERRFFHLSAHWTLLRRERAARAARHGRTGAQI